MRTPKFSQTEHLKELFKEVMLNRLCSFSFHYAHTLAMGDIEIFA